MWILIAWVVGDLVGFASAWFIAHSLGYRKGYATGREPFAGSPRRAGGTDERHR